MARRLLSTVYWYAENVYGSVYYDDGRGSAGSIARRITVDYVGAPPSRPPDQKPATGTVLLAQFCEGREGISATATATHPFAALQVDPAAALCAAPTLVCDLRVTGTLAGTTATIAVTTTHGPWSSSINQTDFTEGRTVYADLAPGSYEIRVRDAAGCLGAYGFTVADPQNPVPPGVLLDYFAVAGRNIQIYVETTFPYTAHAYAPDGLALPGPLTAAQRGRQAGEEIRGYCLESKTLLTLFASLEIPYATVTYAENSPVCGWLPPDTSEEFTFAYLNTSPETEAGSDGFVQAATTGQAPGYAVAYSLDNFAGNGQGQASGTFQGLRAGVYTLYAREVREQGRVISRQFSIGGPAYGLRYQVDWKDPDADYSARLLLRAHTGSTEMLLGSEDVGVLEWAGANASAHHFDQLLCGSSATLRLIARPGDDLNALADVFDERQLRVDILRNNVLVWTGWMLPDLFEEPHLPRPYVLSLRATDGLGSLPDMPLADGLGNALRGEFTHWQLLRAVLGPLQLPLPWAVLHTLYPEGALVTPTTEPLQLVSCDVAGFTEKASGTQPAKPWSCGKVLLALLAYHQM